MAKAKKVTKKIGKKISKKTKAPAKVQKTKVKAKVKAKKSSKAAPMARKVLKSLNSKSTSSSSKLKFIPLGDRVLIAQNEGFSETSGGLLIPVAYQEKPLQGEVIQIGPGFKNKKGNVRPLDVRIGDEVLFDKYAGSSVQMDGKNYLLLSEKEIIGVVTKS